MTQPSLNRDFPACAQVARRLLAEVYGCKPGDVIPGEADLLEASQRAIGQPEGLADTFTRSKAVFAVAMVEEIGGIFEQGGK